jgi:RND superfamily putative drug exporter
MFAHLAGFTSKYKIPVVIVWIALSVALIIFAPSLSQVGVTDDTQFLPRNTESTQAETLLREKFSAAVDQPAGSALLVVYDPQGLSQADLQEARELCDWLVSKDAPPAVTRVTSIFSSEVLRATLVSRDQTAMLVNIDLSKGSSSAEAREAVKEIRSYIQNQHFSARMYLSGSSGISYDALTSIQQTIDKATLVTIILVIILLLLIYRSPVAIFVPLITIGVSYLVARGIAGYIAASGSNVSSLVDAYLVVTLFGIGTDYCLFMVSRFKEEIVQADRKMAVELSLKRIGPVILASATTVIVALLCLGISRFGMNRTSGFILAIGVAITLLAGLTLAPALISLFGRNLLWPARLKQSQQKADSFWNRVGRQVTRRPVALAVPIIVVLALPYIVLPKITYSASLLSEMPKNMDSVQGYNIVRGHFQTGELNPINIVIESPNTKLTAPDSLKSVENMAVSLKTVQGVSRVQYFSAPSSGLFTLSQQSRSLAANLSLMTASQLTFYQTLGQNLQELAVQYPGVTQSTNFQRVVANLMQISAIAKQIQPTAPQNIPALLDQIRPLASAIGDGLEALSAEFSLHASTAFTQWLQSSYFSQNGTMTRVEVILNTDPYDNQSISAVSRVREALGKAIKASGLAGITYYAGGVSAGQADILAVNGEDFLRVLGLSIIGILVVTVLLLRSILAPLYMIATVLFNFGATLGIATWLFLDVLKQNSEIYMLPIFVFVILIAVGSDYNIFLVSRIREEAYHKPLKDAICNAVANTGGVITSCGIILAGTFGTLTTASLQMVFQVGAAIGIGVLIDTFLVRAVLIPSLAAIVGKWSWWPFQLSGNQGTVTKTGN